MNCLKPFVKGVVPFPCGQCLPCRINRRRLWAHRILLESLCHESSAFVTLTYAEEFLPSDRSVSVAALQGFMKRLRKFAPDRRFRFFGVGEYGDENWRPHYHLALFGLDILDNALVAKAWPFGRIQVAELNKDTAAYCAGYVTKKLTSLKDDDVAIRLGSLSPEFARMSLRPGIGALALSALGEWLVSKTGSLWISEHGDVPWSLQHGKRVAPLGRYLRQKLRDEIGLESPGYASAYIREKAVEMSALLGDNARASAPFKSNLIAFHNRGRIKRVLKRAEIYTPRRKL